MDAWTPASARRLVLGVVRSDHPVGPVEHEVAVLLGHPHEVGDDLQRQLGGDLLHEVGRALLADGVEDRVGGGHHLGLEVTDHARREALVDQPPVAGVHRRVHVQHHHALLPEDLLVEVVEERGRPVGGEVLVVPVDRHAVVVAGDRPEAVGESVGVRVPLHRHLPAQVGEPGVGHRLHEIARVAQVDVGSFHVVSPIPARPAVTSGAGRPRARMTFLERVSVIIGRPDRPATRHGRWYRWRRR